MTERIPATVLTGYLGAGKTTLLNRILTGDPGRRYAIIVNEFGEIGIDGDLIVKADEELFEMNNGCVCCSVRGDLIRTLHGLLTGGTDFDAILVETSGLADPGPVAQTFFVDHVLQMRTALDSITTLVDAKNVLAQLAASEVAEEQIAFADQIVLNKIELVADEALRAIEGRLRVLNPLAPIHRAQRSNVPLDLVLRRGGFDLERIVSLEPDFLDRAPEHDHQHDREIRSVSLSARVPMDRAKLEQWLGDLVARRGADILRAKGIIDIAGEERRLVFQAVHMLAEADLQHVWRRDETRRSRLVFIGRDLDAGALRAGFDACAVKV
jgi:G3E family GTPase